ncbi:MAG TPA: hypothetical protein PKY82_35835, partial [Pyrinomonadaceae bacterium]|nr:hypothetical protein [Pyrinomonadaceae bacterium]
NIREILISSGNCPSQAIITPSNWNEFESPLYFAAKVFFNCGKLYFDQHFDDNQNLFDAAREFVSKTEDSPKPSETPKTKQLGLFENFREAALFAVNSY